MVLMTPERTARFEEINAEIQAHSRVLRSYQSTEAETAAARDAINALKPELETLGVMVEVDKKLAEITPFFGIYQALKPEAVVLAAQAIDEVLDFILAVGNNITKYQEVRESMARSTRATYEAYLAVGFTDTQAFALTVRTLEIFDEQLKKVGSGIKINNKS